VVLSGGWCYSVYIDLRDSSVTVGPCLLDAVFVFEEWRGLIVNALIRAIRKEEKPERQGAHKGYENYLQSHTYCSIPMLFKINHVHFMS
jgi:hypothetical protein